MNIPSKEVTVSPAQRNTMQIVVFRLGDEEYGITIDQIKEVAITPPITRMPQVPAFIAGVSNIRGNIIAILDLGEKFGIPLKYSLEQNEKTYTLVIDNPEFKMGIWVKDVPNTMTISRADIEESFFTGGNTQDQSYITGIVKRDNRLIILIDIFRVLSSQETKQYFTKAVAE
ncbi:MAG TPA: chemotaxis protein CheW [Ohtaekwangia sp.]|uniref:chemotaxis protein CheW n=1 Tax=Ohtaekwangia sp. TaxID=2066019 RepID=UPI002F93DE13